MLHIFIFAVSLFTTVPVPPVGTRLETNLNVVIAPAAREALRGTGARIKIELQIQDTNPKVGYRTHVAFTRELWAGEARHAIAFRIPKSQYPWRTGELNVIAWVTDYRVPVDCWGPDVPAGELPHELTISCDVRPK